MKFTELGLEEPLLKIIEESGFDEPTGIQEKTIPLALAGKDIIGGSPTGSGKTLAFGAGIIEKVKKSEGTQSIVLTPTRELAQQVGSELKKFSRYKHLTVGVVYGGVAIGPQVEVLTRAEIIVGTPGRILDHMERGTLKLKNVRILVLDEADKMLDMGFIEDVERIIMACPRERQTLLFSATISPDISQLAKKYMLNPVEVESGTYVDPAKLDQVYYDVPKHLKFSLLIHLLKNEKGGLVMVFCNTRHNTDFVAKNLQQQDIDALATHGGLTQARRNAIMEKFRANRVYVIVCTDVAARGLDVPNISHVYNYDVPQTGKEYIHRIGRTARAGSEGKAISLVSDRDYDNFRRVLQNPSVKIKAEKLPALEPIRLHLFERRPFNRAFGGGRGRRFEKYSSQRERSTFGRERHSGGLHRGPQRHAPRHSHSRIYGRRH